MFRNGLRSCLSVFVLLGNNHDDSWLAVSWSHCSEMQVIWGLKKHNQLEMNPTFTDLSNFGVRGLTICQATSILEMLSDEELLHEALCVCIPPGADNGYGKCAVTKSLVGQNCYQNQGWLLIIELIIMFINQNSNQIRNQISMTGCWQAVDHHQQLL